MAIKYKYERRIKMKKIIPLFLSLSVSLTACAEKDTVTPLLTLAEPTVEIELGESFSPLSYVTATDDIDGNITSSIVVKANDVNTEVSGTYSVVFEVKDKAGNAAQTTLQVVIQEGYTELDLILIEMLQMIVDMMKDPASFQIHSIQSRGFNNLDDRIVRFDFTATNSYGANIRTTYYLMSSDYFSSPSRWINQINDESTQSYYDSGWITPDFPARDENAEKIFKKVNLYS